MSLLETMRNKKKDILTERHPMKDADRGTRFAYLVGLAMGAVVDGTVHPKEREAIIERAFTLELPEEDGKRAIDTAEKADDGTISSVLDSLNDPTYRALFLTDLKIMGHSDGSVTPEEDELWSLFADMMKVDEDERKALTGFASAAMASDGKAASEALSVAVGKGLKLPLSDLKFFLPSGEKLVITTRKAPFNANNPFTWFTDEEII